MNKVSLSSIVVAANLVLVGCDDSSTSTSPESPVSQARTVTVGATMANITEMNALSNTCLKDIELPEDKVVSVQGFDNNVCAVKDLDGNVHYVRTNDYSLVVTDMYGTNTYDINDIVVDGIQDVEVFGEATFKIEPKIVKGEYNQFYSYYLVEGEEVLGADKTHVVIHVDNKDYSYVTFTVADREDIDFYHSTITETREESKNFGATYSGEIEGSIGSDYGTHAYRYIDKDAVVLITAFNGASVPSTIEFEPMRHFNLGELKIDPKSGEIIITPPDFGDPIEIIPTPVAPVIKPSQVDNAELVHFDESGFGIFKTVLNRNDLAEPWLYPEVQFVAGEKTLKQYDFSYSLDVPESFKSHMDIYLLDEAGELVRVVYYPNGNVDIKGGPQGISKADFVKDYGHYRLDARIDGLKFKTNFIIRVADDNDVGDLQFTVKEYTVKELAPVLSSEQLVGGTILDSIDDTNHSVDIEFTGNRQSSVDNPLWVYTDTKFPAKEGDAPTLGQVSIDVDVEVSDTFSDKAASDAYISIYLDGWNATETFSLYVSGQLKGQVVQRTHREDEGQEVYSSYDSFQAAYFDTKVKGLAEGTKLNTNFILRFGDNDNGNGEDGNLLGEVVAINSFDITIEWPIAE
ncbi:hypothetical protein AB4455_01950 [Vibrio sp. 10N.261.46.E12]|uniref:hypothetical protein n=1 Tax=unclassified Vibrio TaxID=2614977 RepID=UPI000976FD14|nr:MULTISPECIES: hypothetical protein [unclassified Vibrio]OMO37023.1 hypothetical protein BH584_02570 [Vibrio sp. 10N.261.45.E1]PMJ24121.1 hypothetical protein BCU27_14250 [Vibrio sp. 10N.286.45.B6]PML90070.1 hypothetical protein BCT66_05800 [Vibrio sp. 10N.261.49.E11]PMM75731.1 hypothetical protein BCT48_02595 [Vibrio sp. 10N.261.46.F12]PMM85145.1 hypothetical protein BCT46_09945 [Vibrio sp. 10N.261.46.E8]